MKSQRLTNLRNEIRKAKKEATGISVYVYALLSYSFAFAKDSGKTHRAMVVDIIEYGDKAEDTMFQIEFLSGDRELVEYNLLIHTPNIYKEEGDDL